MKSYCFDLDGTLCTITEGSYKDALPHIDRIEIVNRLFELGNFITIFTARGTTTGIDWRALTEEQLSDWNIMHHRLILGKPFADFYIDDKGISDSDFFNKVDL